MSDTDNAIVVKDLFKSFKLPHEQSAGIKSLIVNFLKHKKGYETQHVLDNISFEIKKGEFFGIVGRNGSGKSTLLKLLAGIYVPDSGLIQVNGSLTPFIELGVGFNPELTGRENVFLNGALLGFSQEEMHDMYGDIVAFAELKKFMDQKLKNYSSGMQVRLAFSIAIRAKSDILILDEVLAVGDQAFQKKCYEYFDSLKDEHKTVILVTHDMSAVRRFCDRALLIESGKIMYRGAPSEIALDYQELFSAQPAQPVKGAKKITRWGTGDLVETKTEVSVTTNEIIISTTHLAHKDLTNPIIGFTLLTDDDVNVLEANTLTTDKKLGNVHKGDKINITWKLDNLLKSGNYRMTVGSCNRSLTNFYDWNDDAARIRVVKTVETNGIVIPTVKAEVTNG